MTIKIDADTSSGLQLESDTSGIIDIQSAGVTKMTVGTTIDIQGNELVLDADADTSIHADTDDQIDFKVGGTDRVKMTSSRALEVVGDSAIGTGFVQSRASHPSYAITCGGGNTVYFHIQPVSGSFTEFMQVRDDTQIRIGTTGELNNSHVCIESNSTNPNGMEIRTDGNNNAISFYSGSTTYAGAITLSGASTSYTSASDYRLKENVSYTWDATTRLKQLKPCRFNWIDDNTETAIDGFLAHEVSDIVPDAVKGAKDATKSQNVYDDDGNITGTETVPDYQGIDQSKIVPLLVKTIQELEARITALESE